MQDASEQQTRRELPRSAFSEEDVDLVGSVEFDTVMKGERYFRLDTFSSRLDVLVKDIDRQHTLYVY